MASLKTVVKKRKLTISSVNPLELKCNHCGSIWSPQLKRHGRLPNNYWKCPRRCNEPITHCTLCGKPLSKDLIKEEETYCSDCQKKFEPIVQNSNPRIWKRYTDWREIHSKK